MAIERDTLSCTRCGEDLGVYPGEHDTQLCESCTPFTPTVMRGAELVRVVAVYECDECGREYALIEGEDYTGIPSQEFMHRCEESE